MTVLWLLDLYIMLTPPEALADITLVKKQKSHQSS